MWIIIQSNSKHTGKLRIWTAYSIITITPWAIIIFLNLTPLGHTTLPPFLSGIQHPIIIFHISNLCTTLNISLCTIKFLKPQSTTSLTMPECSIHLEMDFQTTIRSIQFQLIPWFLLLRPLQLLKKLTLLSILISITSTTMNNFINKRAILSQRIFGLLW